MIDTGTIPKGTKVHNRKPGDGLGGPDVKPKAQTQRAGKKASGPDVTLKSTDASAFNTENEKFFVELLAARLEKDGMMKFNSACDWVAFKAHISVETAKRYLRKFSADDPEAPFVLEGGCVRLRSEA